jgi:hypothetical protein
MRDRLSIQIQADQGMTRLLPFQPDNRYRLIGSTNYIAGRASHFAIRFDVPASLQTVQGLLFGTSGGGLNIAMKITALFMKRVRTVHPFIVPVDEQCRRQPCTMQ